MADEIRENIPKKKFFF